MSTHVETKHEVVICLGCGVPLFQERGLDVKDWTLFCERCPQPSTNKENNMTTKTYPTLDPSTVVVETATHWLQMPTEYDADEVTDEDIAYDGAIVDLSSAGYGWLIDCRTGKFIRPATCAESDASDDGGEQGLFEFGGMTYWVN